MLLFNTVHPAIMLLGPDSEFPKKEKESKRVEIDCPEDEKRR